MNLLGIGLDVVEVARIEDLLQKKGDAFISRTLTVSEWAYCKKQSRPAIHVAARFAAKEAVAKAFGTGIGKNAAFLDIEIQKLESGAPQVVLHGAALAWATEHDVASMLISLTHTDAYAAAQAVVLAKKK